ncbi:hypothetical protein LMG27177_03818 [Paraburkholderia fynbosensis]|uniref:Uncharacterized protein n=1 Tax=Paraburkholderia fynbosensis TaxID=1200993 RepID=A0A6J5G783_9BURK|nr:hypothetical protein LMG27177_03818 [Paraburkholderia fynbosensis]
MIAAIAPSNKPARLGESKFASERRVYQTRSGARRAAQPAQKRKRPSGICLLGRTYHRGCFTAGAHSFRRAE